MSEAVFWVHDDCLRNLSELPSVYVFDVAKIERGAWALKRIGFIYECLMELPVEIRKGDPVDQVAAFAAYHGAERIVTMATPDPSILSQQAALSLRFQLHVEHQEPFVQLEGRVDLRRFSRYWQKAQSRIR